MVPVGRLDLRDPPVDPVAGAQHDGREQRRAQGSRQHRHLHVRVALAPDPEGELPDQQRHGEPDPREDRQPRDVDPGQALVEVGAREAGHQPGRRQDADGLAQHQRDDDADRHRISQRGDQATRATDRDPRREQREDRHRDPGGEGPEAVLEVLGETRTRIRSARPLAAQDRHHEAEQDAGDRRMHARGVHERPHGEGQRQQQPPRPDPTLHQDRKDPERDHGHQERDDLQLGGEEDGDDRDRQEVVDDREREQERAQRRRQTATDHREHGEGEGDVGRDGDRPALRRAAVRQGVDHRVDDRGHDHPADGGRDRHRGPAGVAQVTGDELPLELQARHEEEDRQQPVRGPGRQGKVEVQGGGPDREGPQSLVPARPRRVRPHQRHDRADHEQRTTDGLLTQDVGDAAGLRPRTAIEQAERAVPGGVQRCRVQRGIGHGRTPSMRGQVERCRPDFPAHRLTPYSDARAASWGELPGPGDVPGPVRSRAQAATGGSSTAPGWLRRTEAIRQLFGNSASSSPSARCRTSTPRSASSAAIHSRVVRIATE